MKVSLDCNFCFDSDDPGCSALVVEGPVSQQYAFVQFIDSSIDGQARIPRRRWGHWHKSDAAGSLRRIMKSGAPWPALPPPLFQEGCALGD